MQRRTPGSFRQLLLFAFLLITALLVGVALRAVFKYDALMLESREAAVRALRLSGASQSLAERSAGMERAARQSLVLNDAVLRQRFFDTAVETNRSLERLADNGVPKQTLDAWSAQLQVIEHLMAGPPETALTREATLATQFRELEAVNTSIAQQAQTLIEERDDELEDHIESARLRLMREVLAASVLAVVLALGFGIWLARPFQRLERAIVALGQNRLDTPIDIHGPSDVRRVAQQLDWLRLRLMELDADKARFLRHVSHELKTPLAALREGVSLLQDGVAGPLSPAQREVTHILQQNTLALQNQIEALLQFNAAAFEARQLQRTPTSLLELINAQVEAQRLQWQAQELVVHVSGEAVTLAVDASKLGAALGNLLSNAIRYSTRGGAITFTVESTPGWARIAVADEGPGIPASEQTRVFEPFFRGEQQPQKAIKGTGIGLSIVREYIAAHGGRIALLPEGPGAHFVIELPMAD